jgi:RHS repeat-associated protein
MLHVTSAAAYANNGQGSLKAGNGKVDYVGRHQQVFDGIVKNLKFLGADGQILTAGKSGKVPPGQVNGTGNIAEAFRYFFHPDHLGSTSYVTDASGEVSQHIEYMAFGETFVQEHSNTDRTPYLFNGKELDEETGLYYYGARYYQPRTSVWQSVDKQFERMPGWSPYNYSLNNPITYFDPDGNYPWPVHIRSFISTSTTAGGTFYGDGRGASFTGTSRVFSTFTVDPSAKKITQPETKSDPTIFYGIPTQIPPMVDRGKPEGSNDNPRYTGNSASFDFSHSGKDPITPGIITPELDVHAGLTFNEDLKNGVLSISGSFTGDQFPSTEAFVTDQSGNNLFLGAKKEKGGLLDLFGDNKKPLFQVNMQIMFDDKGNFTGVKHEGKTYSVDDWNKKVQNEF